MAKSSTLAIRFLQSLSVPTGKNAGKPLKLAPFQKQFVRGALDDGVEVAVLSVGRGNGKSALSAGLALGALLGVWDDQPRREVLLAARNREQARVAWNYVADLSKSLPDEVRARLTFRENPRLEIELEGGHMLRAIPADGKSVLGTSPTLALLDERGHWEPSKGDELEGAILSGLVKRGGRALIVSTSAPDDTHSFSQWIDQPPPGTYVQEHRPAPGLPADDRESLLEANPGCNYGIGATLERLESAARQAIARGGHALSSYRLFNRNERIAPETQNRLLEIDEWRACETEDLPDRAGPLVIGIDMGGSSSMSGAAFYWPEVGRLETLGTFPSNPPLLQRGQNDAVKDRYVQMHQRGELSTIGNLTVPVAPWLVEVLRQVEGEDIVCLIADRYKQAEVGEGIERAGIRCPVVWRGTGWRDGGEDVERFRRACFEGKVRHAPSLLMRSAISDAICLTDPANNLKLAKARSLGRIDAVQAAVIAVAEGVRRTARPVKPARRPVWV
ncbi:terminase large subunit domain-containing protein [Halovulum sp. GXIMD14794]